MTLDEFMAKNELTDTVAAGEIGLSRGYFSRVRTGAVHASLDTALRIYDWTGGAIDLRSLVPRRLRNPRIERPVKLTHKHAA